MQRNAPLSFGVLVLDLRFGVLDLGFRFQGLKELTRAFCEDRTEARAKNEPFLRGSSLLKPCTAKVTRLPDLIQGPATTCEKEQSMHNLHIVHSCICGIFARHYRTEQAYAIIMYFL